MKGDSLRKFASSSWLLAIPPALAVILLVPPFGSRFNIDFETIQTSYLQAIYADLNSDQTSELIYSAKGLPWYHISVKNNEGRIYDQWNLKDSLNKLISGIFTGNYDKDAYREIYVFSHRGDSLFLNINEMLEKSGTRIERIYITRIGYLNNSVSSMLQPAGFFDTNGDGADEVYFTISSSFTVGPRKLYCYDIINGELILSPQANNVPLNLQMIDINNDQKPEIFGRVTASGNFRSDAIFSDSSCWFMVFNDRLAFKFPPLEFPGFASSLDINSYNSGFMLVYWAAGTDTSLSSRIMLYTAEGNPILSRELEDFGVTRSLYAFVFNHPESDRFIIAGNKLLEIDGLLNLVRSVDIPFGQDYFCYRTDVNNDGSDELLLAAREGSNSRILLFNENLELLAEDKIPVEPWNWNISHCFSGIHRLYINSDYINSGNTGIFIVMKPNKYYYLGYLTHPLIYIFFLFFIILIRRINTLQIVKKEDLRKKLISLQLQGIKAQFDPHFTFNTLNSVASLIYNNDQQTAYDYMNRFSQLLRSMLNDADKIYRKLGEEIEFVKSYLELEMLRFGDKFNYSISTGEGVTLQEEVPKLVLHTFVENAVKHGLIPCQEGGRLIIIVERKSDYLNIMVEDNGIGRANAANGNSTGIGLRLTTEFYEILNQINRKPIKYDITDLFDEKGNPSGTRVDIRVPLIYASTD